MKGKSSCLSAFPWVGAALTFILAVPVSAATPAPANLQAVAVSSVQVILSWADASNDEDGFKVERSADGADFSQIGQVLAGTTVFRDHGAWPGRNYSYRVRAYNASGDSDYSPAAIAATPAHCSGNVFGWGGYSAPTHLTGIVMVATASQHGLAVKTDGTVLGWGGTGYGEQTPPIGLTDVVAVAAYPYLSLALKRDGTVVGWGYQGAGETTPPISLHNAVAISAGGAYGLALRNDGTVTGWGYNNWGQASPPSGLYGVVAISAGYDHALALRSDGTVVAWGHDAYGGTAIPAGLNEVIAIAAGEYHSVALRRNGTMIAWGRNDYGQANIPAGLSNVVAVQAGSLFTSALKSDGSVVAWGLPGSSPAPEGLTGAWRFTGTYRTGLAISCAPFSPTALTAMGVTTNRVDLTWADNSDDETGFNMERALDIDGAPGNWIEITNLAANVTSFSDATVLPSTKYWYRGRAANAGGTSPYGNQVSVATPPLAGPTALKATVISATQISLSWIDNSANEDGFKVERALDSAGGPGTWTETAVIGANSTTCHDTTLMELTRYWFRVKAYNSAGESPYSNPTNALTPLGAPALLATTAVATNRIELTWVDTSALEDGFRIERAHSLSDQSWVPIATNLANVTFYAHTNTSCNETNYYRVRAFLGTTNSAYSGISSNSVAWLDSDSDGLPDCWCLKYFNHPVGSAGDNSRPGDNADGDPASNLQEFLTGTNPTNSTSYLRLTSSQIQPNGVRLAWTTVGGRRYVVQTNAGLDTAFVDFSPVITMPGITEATTSYLDTTGTTNRPLRLYRIRVLP